MRTRQRSWSFSLAAALVLLCPFDLIASLGMDMYLPAVPELPRRLAATPERVQLTLAAYLVFLGAGQLVFGPLSDRVGRRPVLLGGAAGFVVSSLALASASSYPIFLALRIAEAASGAAMLVATFATVRDVYAAREEGVRIYAIMSGILVFVPAFGPLVGAGLYQLGGFATVMATLAALTAVAGARAFVVWPETRPAGARHVRLEHVSAVVRSRVFWAHTLGHGVAMGSFFVHLSLAPRVLIHQLGYSPLGFSVLFGTVAIVLIGAARQTEKMVRRVGAPRAFVVGLAVIALGSLGALLPSSSAIVFLAPMWVVAVGMAMVVSVAANGALAPIGDIAGTATALFQCAGTLFFVSAGTAAVFALPDARALTAFASGSVALVLVIRGRPQRASSARRTST